MKKIISFSLVLVMVLSVIPQVVFAEAPTELIIHYHRFDSVYENWNLWIWPESKAGTSYEFTDEDEFGKVAVIPLENIESVDQIGFIVRKGDWEAKDVDQDRFIPVNRVNAKNQLEIFVVQGSETFYFDASEIDLSPKFLSAQLIDEKTVKITSSKPIPISEMRSGFSLVDSDGTHLKPAAVSGGSGDMAQNFVVLLEDAITIGKDYVTEFGTYAEVPIDISGIYGTEIFESTFGYTGVLGASYTKNKTTFRVWSPLAEDMTLVLYAEGLGPVELERIPMRQSDQGVWEVSVEGDLHGFYYTYAFKMNGQDRETYDPYAVAAGVNGDRSMVVDFEQTHPEGWQNDRGPVYEKSNDAIVYEMHIRDFSIHPSSGIEHAGKYLGVVESGTQTDAGTVTGLDHLKELGVTHVQILPMYDFNSIDERQLTEGVFNWGYDPKNYSVPEGSYATDPYNGESRILEMKQMIKGLHDAGIGVIMDVVYNHTALSADSNLNLLMPGYYYRMDDGKFSNASGTGNETASERIMVRKLILDSLKHWVETYHIDGFRFDLMGVHDIETMQVIEKELKKINPNIILYGEGWTGGTSTLPDGERLLKANLSATPTIGAFNDDMRDGIKGHVFNAEEGAFASGYAGFEESVKFGIVGAVFHPQVNYDAVNYSNDPWAVNPSQSVNYVSAHDNLTLWDKFQVTNPAASEEERIRMHMLSNAIVLTSQGMPFLHLGVDFLRTKEGDHNSYMSPDSINQIDWNRKTMYHDVFDYHKGLIDLRKNYPAFRLSTQSAIESGIVFFSSEETSVVSLKDQMIGYMIPKNEALDISETLIVIFNGRDKAQEINLPGSEYKILVNGQEASAQALEKFKGGRLEMPSYSALVLSTEDVFIEGQTNRIATDSNDSKGVSIALIAVLGFVFASAGVLLVMGRQKKKTV